MDRFKLIFAMALTCITVAVANVIIAKITGFNLYSFSIWFILPVGAALVGFGGTSGAVLAARYFNIKPKWIDFVPLVITAAATMWLIYYLDYATFVLNDGRKVSDILDFESYVDLVLTKSHMRFGRAALDTGELGEAGYYFAAVQFVGFLVGGVATFGFIKAMPECADCTSFIRKLKSQTSPDLNFDEASKILELFKTSDFENMQTLLAWRPEDRKFDKKDQRAQIIYTLHSCPKCKVEALIANVRTFNGTEWKEVSNLSARRNLSANISLRTSFN